jgi:hypothetical protein
MANSSQYDDNATLFSSAPASAVKDSRPRLRSKRGYRVSTEYKELVDDIRPQ